MRAFTKKQAQELGESILNQFENMIANRIPVGKEIVLPFQITLPTGRSVISTLHQSGWYSSVRMDIPYFVEHYPMGKMKIITFNEWLKKDPK